VQIGLAKKFGPLAGLSELFADPLYRCRSTSLWISYGIDQWAGLSSGWHSTVSVTIHFINSLLIAAFGYWRRVGWRLSLPAAVFFAIYEGHQEAVVWIAALPELLVFLFGAVSLLAWLVWLQGGARNRWLLAGSLAAFALALLSKESAIVVVPLMAGAAWLDHRFDRHVIGCLLGLTAASVGYAWAIFSAASDHLHLGDGTFDWRAPFWLTVPHSILRMLWFWGGAALVVIAVVGWRSRLRLVCGCVVVMVVTLVPYSFLTYMTRVPSRHTYLASAALSFLVAGAWLAVRGARWYRPMLGTVLVAVVLVHNIGYLWVKKLPQYERRAAATERFLQFAARHEGPIWIQCFPYGIDVPRFAVSVKLGRHPASILESPRAGAVAYCESEMP
jgi:hypothetical protein